METIYLVVTEYPSTGHSVNLASAKDLKFYQKDAYPQKVFVWDYEKVKGVLKEVEVKVVEKEQ